MRKFALAVLLCLMPMPAIGQGCGQGNPNCVAPTPPPGDNSNRIANTAWVRANGGGGAVASVSNADGTLTITPTTGAVVSSLNLAHPNSFSATQTFTALTASSTITLTGLAAGTQVSCLGLNASNQIVLLASACGSGAGAVSSVSNADGTLTISPTTGAVVALLALGHANTWTALQTFNSGVTASTITDNALTSAGTSCVQASSAGVLSITGSACGSGAGAVNSVTAADGTLTITPITGLVTAKVATNGVANSNLAQMPATTIKCNNTNGTANAADCIAVTLPATVSWFANDTPAANISKINDRLFLGDATKYLATVPSGCVAGNCTSPNGNDWFSQYECSTSNGCSSYIPWATLVVETSISNSKSWLPFLAATQTAHCDNQGCTAEAVNGFAINNHPGPPPTTFWGAWSYYGECNQTTPATNGFCVGIEIEVSTTNNDGGAVIGGNPDPYGTGPYTGIEIGCGSGMGSPTKFACSQALGIEKNGQPWNAGIIFQPGSITAGAGPAGTTVAVAMPNQYAILWFDSHSAAAAELATDGSGNLLINLGHGMLINGAPVVNCVGGTASQLNPLTAVVTAGLVTRCN
jgi:hypothetical protein